MFNINVLGVVVACFADKHLHILIWQDVAMICCWFTCRIPGFDLAIFVCVVLMIHVYCIILCRNVRTYKYDMYTCVELCKTPYLLASGTVNQARWSLYWVSLYAISRSYALAPISRSRLSQESDNVEFFTHNDFLTIGSSEVATNRRWQTI